MAAAPLQALRRMSWFDKFAEQAEGALAKAVSKVSYCSGCCWLLASCRWLGAAVMIISSLPASPPPAVGPAARGGLLDKSLQNRVTALMVSLVLNSFLMRQYILLFALFPLPSIFRPPPRFRPAPHVPHCFDVH